MFLDFRRIFSCYDAPITREFQQDLSGENFPGYTVPQPVSVHFSAVLEENAVRLTLFITAEVHAECARCLDSVVREFRVEREFFIREMGWLREDNELPFTQDGRLDLRELAYTELVLEVPTVLLCSEKCEGLCPVCGCRKPCACKHETNGAVDERLSILKQLLN